MIPDVSTYTYLKAWLKYLKSWKHPPIVYVPSAIDMSIHHSQQNTHIIRSIDLMTDWHPKSSLNFAQTVLYYYRVYWVQRGV